MAKRIIRIRKNTRTPHVSVYEGVLDGTEDIVMKGAGLQFLVTGFGPAVLEVENRLLHPDLYSKEPQMRDYLRSHSSKPGSSRREMTVDEIGNFAEFLEGVAESVANKSGFRVIGGPIQKATLISNVVKLSDAAVDRPPVLESIAFIVDLNTENSDHPFFGPPTQPIIYANYSCKNAAIFLDNAILLGGKYENCLFYYFGKPFYIDPNDVEITSSFLVTRSNYPDQYAEEVLKILPGTTRKFLSDIEHPETSKPPDPK